jgi:hypothetical protein
MPKHNAVLVPEPEDTRQQVSEVLLDLILRVPESAERQLEQPEVRAHSLGRAAARQASVLAGSLALPPGFLGWLTILPELVGVWKLQAQMVSDIAAVYGKTATLGREQMVYCLFKHVSAQLFRDVVVRVGERYLVRRLSLQMLQGVARALGVNITQKMIGKGVSRFVPLLGAVGVSAYAYFDTTQVAKTAVELFSREITLDAQEITTDN